MMFLKQSMSQDTVLIIICCHSPDGHSRDDAQLRDTFQQVPTKPPYSPLPYFSSQKN